MSQPAKAITNGAEPSMKQRLATLETKLAEQEQQTKRLATALASILATQMQPQLQQQLSEQLLNGAPAAAQSVIPQPIPTIDKVTQ